VPSGKASFALYASANRCLKVLHHGLIERLAIEPETAFFEYEPLLGTPADDLRVDDVLARLHTLGKALFRVAREHGNPGLQYDGT
jgi:hypothetical protein